MRLLHLSDLHFGKTLFEYSLLEDQRHWCGQVLELLLRQPHDLVVIAGDLYDRAVPAAEAVDLCDWFLSTLAGELGLTVLCIAGNHDSPSRLQFGSALYRAGGLHMAARPQARPDRITLTDQWGLVHFHLLPYLSPSDGKALFPHRREEIRSFQDAHRVLMEENRDSVPWAERNVVVAHGLFALADRPDPGADALRTESEVVVGGLDLVDSGLLRDFDYGALGHLHAPQQAGLPHLRYCGSPLAYSVSEEHQTKGVLSVTLGSKGTVEITSIPLAPLRRVRTVRGTLEELLAPTQGGFASDDYVLAEVLTDTALLGVAEQLRNVYPHYLAIRYRSTLQQEVAVGANAQLARLSLEDAFAGFYREVAGRELTEDEAALAAETAAAVREEVRLA